MPELDYALLADGAQVSQGKTFILGGGVSILWRQDYPAPLGFVLVLQLSHHRSEANTSHDLRIQVVDADGNPLLPEIQGQLARRPAPKELAVRGRAPAGRPDPWPVRFSDEATASEAKGLTRFDRLVITRERVDHIAERHGLDPEEAREAFETGGRAGNVFRGPNSRDGGRTYIVRGRTYAGRPLWVLVRARRDGVAESITARHDE